MPTDPRPRREGSADEAAALVFAAADSQTEPASPGPAAVTDASAHDLQAAREARIRRLLDFEAGWTSHGGAKARAIRAEFGWTTTRYYQVLDGVLETTEALRHDPMLVRRLLSLREGR
ncbi:DUF3263 domain-containing protein [Agrococcus lahaulensis]|nr:DUF3263 domain-containing protein [Agrococcus lahaulensis]